MVKDETTARKIVAKNLRAARKAARLTQVQLAQEAGVSQQTISHIEQAHIGSTIDTLARCASALNVPLETLFQE